MRKEKDAFGEIGVPEEAYYGAQTQRSLENFSISSEKIPLPILEALLWLKRQAAIVNARAGLLSKEKKDLIVQAAQDILSTPHWEKHFPLKVWQTGSGTQTNMNVNEAISCRANEIAEGKKSCRGKIHPNDHVNLCQSSNDIFPSAIQVATYHFVATRLLLRLKQLQKVLYKKRKAFASYIKVGRTHLMDAVPLTVGQEFSGYEAQIVFDIQVLKKAMPGLLSLPLGGSAVGTGINTFKEFSKEVCKELKKQLGHTFRPGKNPFQLISSKQALVELSSALRLLATDLYKIANDLRLSASGPRAGLGEYFLPANEPGSSIMPGKVNPTQCEAMTMLCLQVIGNDLIIALANSQGQFQLNTYMPLIGYNLFQSLCLLTEGIDSFIQKCLLHLQVNPKKIKYHLDRSLMMATALNHSLGYDRASQIVKKAYRMDLSLKEAALSEGISEKEIEKVLNPKKMLNPNWRKKKN